MTFQRDPGTILAATEAMRTRDTFTRDQVAYLIALAYDTGRIHGYADDLAETVGCWQNYAPPPRLTRKQRIAERLAEYERTAGPAAYRGGPVNWDASTALRDAA